MEDAGEDRLAICARNWVREFEEVRTQLASVDPSHVMELRFEELLQDPVRSTGEGAAVPWPRAARVLSAHDPLAQPAADAVDAGAPTLDGRQLDCVLRETQPLLRELGYAE